MVNAPKSLSQSTFWRSPNLLLSRSLALHSKTITPCAKVFHASTSSSLLLGQIFNAAACTSYTSFQVFWRPRSMSGPRLKPQASLLYIVPDLANPAPLLNLTLTQIQCPIQTQPLFNPDSAPDSLQTFMSIPEVPASDPDSSPVSVSALVPPWPCLSCYTFNPPAYLTSWDLTWTSICPVPPVPSLSAYLSICYTAFDLLHLVLLANLCIWSLVSGYSASAVLLIWKEGLYCLLLLLPGLLHLGHQPLNLDKGIIFSAGLLGRNFNILRVFCCWFTI